MKYSERYDDLMTFTDTYKLLFAPYIRMCDEVLYSQLYGTSLYKSIVNVYPSWDERVEGIVEGIVYLVLDMNKIENMAQVRYIYTDNDCVTRMDVPPIGGSPSNPSPNRLMVLSVELPQNLVDKFIKGEYSTMFRKELLVDNIGCFLSPKYGIPFDLDDKTFVKVAKEFHILIRSKRYEKVLAAKLGVPYEQFEGKLKEWKSPIDSQSEELNIELLIKQLKSNGK